MGEGRIIAFRILEGFKWGHLHTVGLDSVESPIASMPDVGSGRGKEAFGMRDALHGIEDWCGGCREVRRKIVDLLDVKHGVAFEEWNLAFGILSLLRGLGAGDLADEHHKLAMLSLADLRPEFRFRQNSRRLRGQIFFQCAAHDEAITVRAMRLP
jgi:hypothetical protein